jgi:6-phospho-beta-glucosidase
VHVRGLVHALGEYQALTADAGWSGTRRDAIHALAAHPLMVDLDRTERVYDELALAHREHLPARLLPA